MKIFISGGCKNGKSYYAQKLAKLQQKRELHELHELYYVATMRPADGEDDERIARHKKEREGWGFATVEQPENICEVLRKCDLGGSFLIDSATALLANEMFRADGSINENAAEKASRELLEVINAVGDIVVVSDYIYSDAVIYDELTEKYRDSLAYIDKNAAAACDIVLEIVNTNVIVFKGRDEFHTLYNEVR